MSNSNAKTNKVSGLRIAVMVISILLLSLIMGFSMLLGLSALKTNRPVTLSEDATTYRKRLPTDGTRPTDATPLDNIGYMAYVFDNQQYYHAYAYNSTKSTGYEQITQSWKDYKSGAISGNAKGESVMIASDLSYSKLVKSATQSCFIGNNKALIRNGGKPSGKNTKPLDLEWSSSAPAIYDKNGYKYVYGEFSTEISVYVINEATIERADEVVDNGDGTYSQKYYLNKNAGVWYQYGMKTRGGLKNYPEFKRIEITFTFNDKWEILQSYCEEKATISPRALGGMNMASDSVTTTWFDYGNELDGTHYAYYDNYFKNYEDDDIGSSGGSTSEEPDALTILGSGFSQVLSEDGQQFKLAITIGDIEYDGKVYLKIPDMGDVLGTIDVRIALEKKGTGKQDLYIGFKDSTLSLYYSTGFALTANIDEISQSVNKIVDLVNELTSRTESPKRTRAVDSDITSGLDLSTIIENLKVNLTDTEATVTLKSDDLLGFGVGVDAVISFNRTKDAEGYSSFSIKSVGLNYIKFGGTVIDVNAEIVPDDGTVIMHNQSEAPANLADYVDSIYDILNSNTVKIDLSLSDELVKGLTLDATAYVSIASEVASDFEISITYKTYEDISLKLSVSYVIESGNLYIRLTEFNGNAVNAKVYCNVADAVDTISGLISAFNGGMQNPDNAQALASSKEIAGIINKILNINFGKVIGNIRGDENSISFNINIDQLLKNFDVSLGFELGTLTLTLDKANGKISGSDTTLGLNVDISGADKELPSIGDVSGFLYINDYLSGIAGLITSDVYELSIIFAGTQISGVDLRGLEVNATAYATFENGFKNIAVSIPGLVVSYKGLEVELSIIYYIDINSKDYGTVYLEIKRINESEDLGIKVYCDIKDTVGAVKEIVAIINGSSKVQALSEGEEESVDIISKVIGILLSLDYNEIITSAQNSISVTINVDEILSNLGLDWGITFDELKLALTLDDDKNCALVGSLVSLGVKEVRLTGNNSYPMPQKPADGEYVDLATYLKGAQLLLNKPSYTLELSFTGNGNLSSDINLTGVEITLNAQFAFIDGFKGVRVNISELSGSYNGVSLTLSAYYEVSFNGGYGTVYIDITNVNGTDIDAKIVLDITDAVDNIKAIISRFTPKTAKTDKHDVDDEQIIEEESDVLGKLLGAVLQLDFSEFLTLTKDRAELNLDLGTLVSGFNLGLNLGVLTVEYVPQDGTLHGWDDTIGLDIEIVGSELELSAFTPTGEYINVNNFIDGIKKLTDSDIYAISLDFVGTKIKNTQNKTIVDLSGLTAKATAYAVLENGYYNIAVSIPDIEISYKGLDVVLSIYYTIDISAKNYGLVYLDITKIGEVNPDLHLSCDIKDAVTAVQNIIKLFKPAQVQTLANEGEDVSDSLISKIIGILLNIDYAEVINCTQSRLTVTLGVDELLNGIGLGWGITFGELKLALTLDDEKNLVIGGNLAALGLNNVTVNGISKDGYKMPQPKDEDYVDFGIYFESISELLKKTLNITITLDGTHIDKSIKISGINLADLSVNATATVKISNGIIRVMLPATVVYGDYTVELSAYYTIALSSGDYGTVYLHIDSITSGDEVNKLNANVYGDIKSIYDNVKKIIAKFTPNKDGDGNNGDGNNGDGINTENDVQFITKVIDTLLKLDFSKLLTVTDELLTIKVDVNRVLSGLGVSLGDIELGELNLTFDPASKTFDGSVSNLGLHVTLEGTDNKIDFSDNGYIDIGEFVSAIENLVKSKTYEIAIGFTGKDIEGIDLEGLFVDTTVYATLEDGYNIITVSIPSLIVSYKDLKTEKSLKVELSVYYTIDLKTKNYGTVYFNLISIDETTFNAKVYCNIKEAVDTVQSIIDMFKKVEPQTVSEQGDGDEGNGSGIIAKVVKLLLGLDYNNIIGSTQNELSVTVNVDEILAELEIGLKGITFGELELKLTQNKGKNAVLSGRLEKYGVTMTVAGNDSYPMPNIEPDDYLNLNTVLKIAEDMSKEVKKIADAEHVAFTLLLDTKINGRPLNIDGTGEVSWLNGSIKVEISLTVTVDKETLEVTFVYDETASDEEPFIILAINKNWTKISRREIDKLVSSFSGLIDAFNKDDKSGNDTPEVPEEDTPEAPDGAGYAFTVGGKSLAEILTNVNVKAVLGRILGFVSDFAVEIKTGDGEDALSHLLIKYLNDVVIKPDLGADGGLILTIEKGEKQIGKVTVVAGNAEEEFDPIADRVEYFTSNAKTEENDGYVYGDLSAFVKELYLGAFGKLDDVLLKELFGSNYSVVLNFNGDNSGIDVLQGIKVEANLYYGNGTVGLKRNQTKLLYVTLDINISGTQVSASVSYAGSTVYIALEEVGQTKFTGIKFSASAGSLFDAVEQLVRIITDTNLVEMLGGGTKAVALSDKEALDGFATLNDKNGDPAPSTLTKLLDAILNLEFRTAFEFDKEEGTLKINIDSITRALFGVDFGTLSATFDNDGHTLNANVTVGENDPWIELIANPCKPLENEIVLDDYVDISFISTLISDLKNTATNDDNKIYTLYTFAGGQESLKVHVDAITLDLKVWKYTIGIDLVFDYVTITAGLDKNDNFYFSFGAKVRGNSILGYTIADEKEISVTYSNGFVILGRDINSDSAIYKVVTLNYLLENIANTGQSEDDSPVRWLLGTSDTLWGAIFSALNLNLGSNKTYALYDDLEQAVTSGEFNLRNYLNGLSVNFGGAEAVSSFGNSAESAVDKLGLSENYYALDINSDALTGGTVDTLYAAILRDDNGLSGLKAYAEIASRVSISLNLNSYLAQDKTDIYREKGSTKSLGEVALPNYYNYVSFDPKYNDFEDAEGDYKTPVFGCYNTENNTYRPYYEYDIVMLNVYGLDGYPEKTLEVRYASTVYLVREGFPDYAVGEDNKPHKIIYLNAEGEPLGDSVIIAESDLIHIDTDEKGNYVVSIYKAFYDKEAVEVLFHFIDDVTGKPIIGSHTFALDPNAENIADYELNGYSFLGWYSDDSFSKKITAVADAKAEDDTYVVYGRYLTTLVKKDNGVNYTFDYKYWETDEEIIYYVSGTNTNIEAYYSTGKYKDEWFEIASEINGYPVTYIASCAFINAYADANHSLVNVLVPASVIAVYDNAFKDNKALTNVVFLADAVFFGGAATGNDDDKKTSVFYGCYVDANDIDSKNNNTHKYFKLYYNGLCENRYTHVSTTTQVVNGWDKIYYYNYVIGTTTYRVDTRDSGWMFAEFSSEYSKNNFGLTRGVYSADEITEESIYAKAVSEINAMYYLDGFIYGHGIRLNGKDTKVDGIYYIDIEVYEDTANAWYLFDFDKELYYISDDEGTEDGIERFEVNGKVYYFVKPGTEVELTLQDSLRLITEVNVFDNAEKQNPLDDLTQSFDPSLKVRYVIIKMPGSVAYVEIKTAEVPNIPQIVIKSSGVKIAIDNSDGELTFADEVTYVIPEGQYSFNVTLAEVMELIHAESEGYTLLGLAYESNSTLKLETTITNEVYYAIWMKERDSDDVVEEPKLEMVDGSLVLTVKSSGSTLNGWYSDSEFGNLISACTAQDNGYYSSTLSLTGSTVLYSRMQYMLTVDYTLSGVSNESYKGDATSFTIFEGNKVWLRSYKDSKRIWLQLVIQTGSGEDDYKVGKYYTEWYTGTVWKTYYYTHFINDIQLLRNDGTPVTDSKYISYHECQSEYEYLYDENMLTDIIEVSSNLTLKFKFSSDQ